MEKKNVHIVTLTRPEDGFGERILEIFSWQIMHPKVLRSSHHTGKPLQAQTHWPSRAEGCWEQGEPACPAPGLVHFVLVEGQELICLEESRVSLTSF